MKDDHADIPDDLHNGSNKQEKNKDSKKRLPEDLTTAASHSTSGGSERIGDYRILRTIGEGGMGTVYEAEQMEPVRRKVALKLIKWGMDTKQVVARFESERQALALMNHPSIARVFDAGATDEGRPYFVMELVQGAPITQYCDTHRLTTRERLSLFISVCEAVQHAHQKGIIHRDIKASNVLVTVQDEKPVPKIIDFGVAKATSQRLTEQTVFTEYGQLIGTPEYMSPEQAEMTGLDIDTRTDIYSLGVLLYELLVGTLPFDPRELRKAGFDEIRRKIREEEPAKPSTRISTLGKDSAITAEMRRTELPALRRQLKGDLDWITMKSLEKDRTRRYQSALELAADIERHMKNEPVLASPPSAVYQVSKFIRRHKAGVTAGAVVLIALILGIVGTTIGLVRATRAEARMKQEAEISQQVSDFLVNLFEVSDPSEARGNTITAREILDRGAEKIEKDLQDQPLVQARLMLTIGQVYTNLGLYKQAEALLEASLEKRKNLLGEDHPETLSSMNNLANIYRAQGRFKEAEPLYRETLERRRRVLGKDHPDTLTSMANMSNIIGNLGNLEESEKLAVETLEMRTRVLGKDHPDTIISMNNLAVSYRDLGKYKEAEKLFKEALESSTRVLGSDHPDTLLCMENLAVVRAMQGKTEEAERIFKELLEIRKRVLGNDHPQTLVCMNSLGILWQRQGRLDEAEKISKETLDIRLRTLGKEHPSTIISMNNLANVYSAQGRKAEAEKLDREAFEIRVRTLGKEHPDTLVSMNNLAFTCMELGRFDEAEKLHKEALEIRRRVLGNEHPDTIHSVVLLANLYKKTGKIEQARPLVAEMLAYKKKRAELPDADADAKNDYAWELLTCEPADLRNPGAALKSAIEANEMTDHKDANLMDTMALAYHLTGDTRKAIEVERKAISLLPEGHRQLDELKARCAEFEAALRVAHE